VGNDIICVHKSEVNGCVYVIIFCLSDLCLCTTFYGILHHASMCDLQLNNIVSIAVITQLAYTTAWSVAAASTVVLQLTC
jgi:hypothetical protein